jgi:hypothetical protein
VRPHDPQVVGGGVYPVDSVFFRPHVKVGREVPFAKKGELFPPQGDGKFPQNPVDIFGVQIGGKIIEAYGWWRTLDSARFGGVAHPFHRGPQAAFFFVNHH